MLRFVKNLVWLLAVVVGARSAFGAAFIGPIPTTTSPDAFQVPAIAYGLASDLSTPKDVHEEYRRNTPVMYYSVDASFYNFFGPEGVVEIDKAMAMFNSVSNVSSYSTNLTEFPLDSRRENYRAEAAGLYDLKSVTMGMMTEQLGFLEPSRWVWALHARAVLNPPVPPCPDNMEYTIYQRNFPIAPIGGTDTYPATSYVNGVLYTYAIEENCVPPNPLADAVETPVDPLAQPYSAVADFFSEFYDGLPVGGFYTSLTRDDVGALRYLISPSNLNNEPSGNRTSEFVTNAPAIIVTQDLNQLATLAPTSSAATLQGLFPGLTISSTSNYFGLQVTTNITVTLINSPFDPPGTTPSHPITTTNYTTNVVTFFHHTFANIITNTYATHGIAGIITLGVANSALAPAGTAAVITTNVKPTLVSGVFGDFFVLPANLCGAQVLSNLLTTVIVTTTQPTQVTTGTSSVSFVPGSLSFFTNHTLVYLPVTCPVDSVAIRGGVDRIQFIRRDYDSLISQAWDEVTNDYTLPELDVTNRTVSLKHFQRRVPRPDFLFTAVDWAANSAVAYSNTVDGATASLSITLTGIGQAFYFRTLGFNQSARPSNLAGPGTIESPTVLPTLFILNKLAPLFESSTGTAPTNNFLNLTEADHAQLSAWGSFDGTTNAPIVYPNGTSLTELENLITGPAATTPYLPNANIGNQYIAQLNAVGGTAPYTWSLAPTSAGLPAGLTLGSNGRITGIPTGPAAIYDFTVRLMDSAGVYRDTQYTISLF